MASDTTSRDEEMRSHIQNCFTKFGRAVYYTFRGFDETPPSGVNGCWLDLANAITDFLIWGDSDANTQVFTTYTNSA